MKNTLDRDDDVLTVKDLWLAIRRQWLLVLTGPLVGLILAGSFFFTSVPVYEAATTIRVADESAELPVLDILEAASSGSALATEMEVLRSRLLAELVVDTLGLQVRVAEPRGLARAQIMDDVFVERWAPAGRYILEERGNAYSVLQEDPATDLGTAEVGGPVALPGASFTLLPAAREHSRIVVTVREFGGEVAALRGSLSVSRPNLEAAIVRVRYTSPDSQLVYQVPNTLASQFIERRERIRRTRATSTVEFLEGQIDTLALQLAAAEDTLTAFREGQQVVSLQAEAQAQVTQLARLQADRNTIEAERAALQRLMDDITREAESADPTAPSPFTRLISFPSLLSSAATSELLRNLNNANSERSDLLRRRTLQDPDVISITERIRAIETQLRGTAQTYLEGLTNQVRAYDQTLSRFGTELGQIPAKELQLARLTRQQAVLEEVYTLLQNRLQEARIVQAIRDPAIRQVDPAVRERSPVEPKPIVGLLMGLVLGFMLSLGIALGRDFLDDSVHTPEDVEAASNGVPVLGMIPRLRTVAASRNGSAPRTNAVAPRMAVSVDPLGPAAEAFRSLRTNLTFATPDSTLRSLLITSSLPEEGKTTVVGNLGAALANQGSRVLLVDADLRRGVLHTILGAERDPGLTSVLTGRVPLAEAIQQVSVGAGAKVSFLSTGFQPPNPAEMLGSKRMVGLLDSLKSEFDFVLIDTPPLTAVTDASVLGVRVDGVLLVARASFTPRGALKFSADQLRKVHAPIIGMVLNDVDARRDGSYYGAYGQYGTYTSESVDPERLANADAPAPPAMPY